MCTSRRNKVLRHDSVRAIMSYMTAVESRAEGRVPKDTLDLRLVMLRHECGHMSQRRAAFQCGITPRVWQGMEEGRNTANLLDILQIIADTFGYDRSWLAYGGPLDNRRGGGGPRPGGDIVSESASVQSRQGAPQRPALRLVVTK